MVHSLLEKLQKLKNMADGAHAVGNYAEAENAASKFQELLMKHNLDEKQVMAAGVAEKVKMLEEKFDMRPYVFGGTVTWLNTLVSVVAKSSMCSVLNFGGTKKSIFGEPHNVGACLYMVEQIVSKISVALQVSLKAYNGCENRGVYTRGFLNGAVTAIAARLRTDETKITENKEMGLMVINKRAMSRRFMLDKYKTKPGRSTGMGGASNDGYGAGTKVGAAMGLNKGLNVNQKQIER